MTRPSRPNSDTLDCKKDMRGDLVPLWAPRSERKLGPVQRRGLSLDRSIATPMPRADTRLHPSTRQIPPLAMGVEPTPPNWISRQSESAPAPAFGEAGSVLIRGGYAAFDGG
jgi:hypothetical protein